MVLSVLHDVIKTCAHSTGMSHCVQCHCTTTLLTVRGTRFHNTLTSLDCCTTTASSGCTTGGSCGSGGNGGGGGVTNGWLGSGAICGSATTVCEVVCVSSRASRSLTQPAERRASGS